MKLYLAQHGEAVPKEVDPERPLTDAGRLEIDRLADFLADKRLEITRIVHSGKPRAQETAVILGAALAPEIVPQGIPGLAPNDSASAFLRNLHEELNGLLIVGHLPFLGRLVSLVASGDEIRSLVHFFPGTLLCLESDDGQWRLAWMLTPELLPR